MTCPDDERPLSFGADGAERFRGAVTRDLEHIRRVAGAFPEQPGVRITGSADLRSLLSPSGAAGSIAAAVLGPSARPVRAILFNKTAGANWSLAWHQDRTICVRTRIDVSGFGPWTVKAGLHHVDPPFDLLTRMVTVRVHLDDVSRTNAPLLIAPGSHRDGAFRIDAVGDVVRRRGIWVCLADAGDVWLYATPILHASRAAVAPRRRRVLQCDFAAEDLPGGLAWLGI